MPKLSDRMARADVFGDGRLTRVGRDARLLATVLEAVAEPTGCFKADPHELRLLAGFYLADGQGVPPTPDEMAAWLSELEAARWFVVYSESPRLAYLKGFGERQTGYNVCVGVSQTTGEVNPHLPTPECVTLERAKNRDGEPMPKLLPRHCTEPHDLCPCERVPTPSRRNHDDDAKANRKRSNRSRSESKRSKHTPGEGDAGEGANVSPLDALPRYARAFFSERGVTLSEDDPKLPLLAEQLIALEERQGREALRSAIESAESRSPHLLNDAALYELHAGVALTRAREEVTE